MRGLLTRGILVSLLAVACGCRLSRYEITEPLDGRTIEVKSGDRLSVVLDDKPTSGYRWMTSCDDPDISFARETLPPADDAPVGAAGQVRIIVRVARGFDGPAHVRFEYRKPWKGGETARVIEWVLYRMVEDSAPWK